MHILLTTLRHYPEIAVFLTLAIGFWFGKRKFGSFSLGAVTSTLLAGLLVGQLHIRVGPPLESVLFMAFLFAVGYQVGPQFFRALKSTGLQQIAFTAILTVTGFVCAYVLARVLGYDSGLAAGLLAGGYTNSGTLGVATGYFSHSALPGEEARRLPGLAAIGYAVTYPFGAAGGAWFLRSVAPKILGIDLPTAAAALERSSGYRRIQPGVGSAYPTVEARAFRLENHELAGKKARELVAAAGAPGAYVTRLRQNGGISDADGRTVVEEGATVVVAGDPGALVAAAKVLGPEVNDPELLGYPVEQLDLVVTRKEMVGRTVRQFEEAELARAGRGVFLYKLTRDGQELKVSPGLTLQHWDVLTLFGARSVVEDAVSLLGYADRPTPVSDIATMSVAVVIGALIGAVTIHVGGIPLSLSTSVGVLLAGLVTGYLQSRYRTFGRVPGPALWVFNNVGLSGFIAVVGLNAAEGLVSGLKAYGLGLFGAGIVVSLVPLVVGVFAGKYLFKFDPVLTLGACAGGRSSTPSLGALQEAANSPVPALGYTMPYAVARIIMALFGVAIVQLIH